MAPVTTQLGLLALASTVLAQPYHGHGAHRHRHSGRPYKPTGGAEGPYGYANGTLAGPTAFANGTGVGTVGRTSTQTQTSLVTVVPVAGTSSVASNNNAAATSAAAAAASSSSSCSDTVYVTYTPTVTVTAGAASANSSLAASSAASSSSEAAAAGTSASAYPTSAYPASVSSPAASSSSEVAAAGTSASAYPASASSPSAYSAAAPSSVASSAASSAAVSSATSSPATYSPSAYSSSAASSYVPSSSSAAPSATASASGAVGKRGCLFASANNGYLCEPLASDQVTWANNWLPAAGSGLNSSLTFVPQLHSGDSVFTDAWAGGVAQSSSNVLAAFNEPDQPTEYGGANMLPSEAASVWSQFMAPYSVNHTLTSPAVSSSDAPGWGLDWLSQFRTAIQANGQDFDIINIHYYTDCKDLDSATTGFYGQINNATSLFPNKKMYVSEYGCNSGATDAQVQAFINATSIHMDNDDNIERYAYFYANPGSLLNSTGTGVSAIGETYMSC